MDRLVHDRRLLRRADDRRVEGLGDEQVDDGHVHVRAAVDVEGGVAGRDAQRRLAGLVGGAHHTGPARGPGQVHAVVPPQVVGHLVLGIGDDLQGARRQPGGLAGLGEQLDDPLRTARRVRGRPEDDGVAGLGRDDGLEEHGRGGVGHRRHGEDHADGLGHHVDAGVRVVLDDPDGALVPKVVVEELGGDVVLHDLVLEHPEPGLLDGQERQLGRRLQSRDRHRPDDAVHRLLVERAERHRGLGGAVHGLVDLVEPSGAPGGGDGAITPVLQ